MTVLAEVGRPPSEMGGARPCAGFLGGIDGRQWDEQEGSWFLFLDRRLSVAGFLPLLQPQLPCRDQLTWNCEPK